MSFAATLNGQRVTRALVTLPARGAWTADVWIDADEPVASAATLALGDLTLKGTVRRGDIYLGGGAFRLVGGADGWRKRIEAKSYAAAIGVKLSTVAGDAAAAVGETLSIAADRTMGPAFVREAGPAGRVLDQVAAGEWWIDPVGVTQIGPRATGSVAKTAFVVERISQENGSAVVASETPEKIAPGLSLDVGLSAPLLAATVRHRLEGGKLRTDVYGEAAAGVDRMTGALAGVVRELAPRATFGRWYEYRVATQLGGALDLRPVDPAAGLPDLPRVPMRPGLAGTKATVKTGARVLVTFIERGRDLAPEPFVGFYEAPGGLGYLADELVLQAGASGAQPWEHATSIEAIVGLLAQVFVQIGVQNAGPLTGAGLAALGPAILNAAIPLAAAAPVTTLYGAAIAAALAAKAPDPTGQIPGIGWPHVRGA